MKLVGITKDLCGSNILQHQPWLLLHFIPVFAFGCLSVLAINLEQKTIKVNYWFLVTNLLIAISFHFLSSLVRTSKCQEVIHKATHAICFGASVGECGLRLFEREIRSFSKQVEVATNGGYWCAQFM